MELASTSPKQLKKLSIAISESDETLAEFLSSLKTTVFAFPLDEGAFRDELYMLGVNLDQTGVLAAAGAPRVAHVLEAIPSAVVDVFLEGVDQALASAVRREIKITSQTTAKLASPTAARGVYISPAATSDWAETRSVLFTRPGPGLRHALLYPQTDDYVPRVSKGFRHRKAPRVGRAFRTLAEALTGFDPTDGDFFVLQDADTGRLTRVSSKDLEQLLKGSPPASEIFE